MLAEDQALFTSDPDEINEHVASAFCSHGLSLERAEGRVRAQLRLGGTAELPLVDLSYGIGVKVDPVPFDDFYLVTSCTAGRGRISDGRDTAEWQPGTTLVLSAERVNRMRFSRDFSQTSIRVSRKSLSEYASRLTGRALERAPRFALRACESGIGARIAEVGAILKRLPARNTLPPAASAGLRDYLFALLIDGHPNSCAAGADRPAPSRLVRAARDYIVHNAHEAITVAEVAGAVGCSVRSLQQGFRDHLGTTPKALLTETRLELARTELMTAGAEATVTGIAYRAGFGNPGRFSALFAERYGEYPASLLRSRRDRH